MQDPLKVVVLGYYGHLNAGDDLLQQSLAWVFSGSRMLFSAWFPGVDALNRADLIVIGGGSIWPDHSFFQLWASLGRELRSPVMVLGISARREDPTIRLSTLNLIDRAIFFHVRDRSTAEYFGGPSGVHVGADLFWWSPWNEVSVELRTIPVVAVNLQPWTKTSWDAMALIEAISGAGYQCLPWPFHFGSDFRGPQSDCALMGSLGMTSLPVSWTAQPVLQARMVVAMRYHAVQVAVRLGRPVIGFDHHAKTRSFFIENGIPDLCVPLDNPKMLAAALRRLESDYDTYIERIRSIRRSLLDAGRRDIHAFRSALTPANLKKRRETLRQWLARRLG